MLLSGKPATARKTSPASWALRKLNFCSVLLYWNELQLQMSPRKWSGPVKGLLEKVHKFNLGS